ncbi:MAG: hypothetical protein WC734_04345 [Patescibacteria group bacterium]|jgi:hypothetical protein
MFHQIVELKFYGVQLAEARPLPSTTFVTDSGEHTIEVAGETGPISIKGLAARLFDFGYNVEGVYWKEQETRHGSKQTVSVVRFQRGPGTQQLPSGIPANRFFICHVWRNPPAVGQPSVTTINLIGGTGKSPKVVLTFDGDNFATEDIPATE